MNPITTPHAPAPAGHYAQAITHAGLVYVSGQLPIDPRNGPGTPGTIEQQTRQALANLRAVLETAGSSMARVLKTTVYIADIQLWDRVNAIYAEAFGNHRPARAVVPTRELHFGYQIEIEAVGYLAPTAVPTDPAST